MPVDINRHWYRPSVTWLTASLLPLSWVFRSAVRTRRALYRLGLKKTSRFSVPVIVVGNITVGGTGKTPFVLWLANFLRKQGYRPGIVSRGYGGKKKFRARLIEADADPRDVGDEAVLLARRGICPVVIGVDRARAVRTLLEKTDCNLVISDDGLQHYRLGRDIEIALVDGNRRFGNKHFLPAGPLREAVSRLDEVDFIVAQHEVQPNEYRMELQGEKLFSVKDDLFKCNLEDIRHQQAHGVTAIGNPEAFFDVLTRHEIKLTTHAFMDHYLYKKTDFDFKDDLPIVMTEKDAVKCKEFASDRFCYLAVDAKMDSEFGDALLKRINLIGMNQEK